MTSDRIHNAVKRRWDRLISRFLGTLVRVDTQKPQVALTFDDGPDPVFTPDLLEILAAHDARATFFVVGEAAAAQRDLISRMVAAGHAVGNHSWSHASFHLLSGKQRRDQLRRTRTILDELGGVRLFRPPFGHQSLFSRLDIWRMGYQVVTWNILTEDWLGHTAEEILAGLTPRLKSGTIILFHDRLYTFLNTAHKDRRETLAAVRLLLETHRPHLEFVTVPEMLKEGRAVYKNWLRRPDADWIRSARAASDIYR
jgi:peptidoglycan-N-acetylglucosamine deacetylase